MNPIMISRLKQWIEQLSVNQLKSISPIQLKRQLKISDIDLKDLIEYLHKERILAYRFRFLCDCSNECIAYDRILNAEKYICSACGKIITFNKIKNKCEIAYEINKTEVMKMANEPTIDFTKTALESSVVNLGICKKQPEGEKCMEKKDRPVIFFGSSSEAIDKMDDVAAIVATQGFATLKWNSPNAAAFIAGENTIDNLISVTESVDAAIFIFNADDITWFNKKPVSGTVRDNVLFEYGLFMGALGKIKVAMMYTNNPHIPSDLNGITYIDVNEDEAVWGQKLKGWLNRLKK